MRLSIIRPYIMVSGLCLASISPLSLALKPNNITPEELALLPRYCLDAQSFGYGDAYSNTSPNAPKWVAMMGKSFWHIHHHCWALINVRRADKAQTPKQKQVALWGEALGDFEYVVRNTPEDFILLPEILTWMGRTQAKLGQHDQAEQSFEKAKSIKPDYWPPYYHHGELLLKLGRRTEALEIVTTGLRQAPDAKPLQLLFRDLGGRPHKPSQPKLPQQP